MDKKILIKRSIFVVGILIAFVIMIMIITIMLQGGSEEEVTNNTTSEVNETNSSNVVAVLSNQEVEMYNSKIDSYIGNSKKGADVKSLIDAIMLSNSSNVGEDGRFIAIEYKNFENYVAISETTTDVKDGIGSDAKASGKIGDPGYTSNNEQYVIEKGQEMTKLKAAVNGGKEYKITASYNDNGLIKLVIIEELGAIEAVDTNTVDNNTVDNTIDNSVNTNTVTNTVPDTNTVQTNNVPESNTVDPADAMKQQEIAMYNSKLKAYVGESKSGVDAKSVIDVIISSNTSNTATPGRFVSISYVNFSKVASHTGKVGDPGSKNNNAQYVTTQNKNMTTLKAAVQPTLKYTIDALYDSEGYIVQIKLTEIK